MVFAGQRKGFGNADRGAECCYIRLHMRGREAGMAMAVFGQAKEETAAYARAVGVDA